MNVEDQIAVLGKKARDKVTGIEGVIDCVTFDLYGCVQVGIMPKCKENNEPIPGKYFDFDRVTIIDETPVMKQPSFVKKPAAPVKVKGPASDKPVRN